MQHRTRMYKVLPPIGEGSIQKYYLLITPSPVGEGAGGRGNATMPILIDGFNLIYKFPELEGLMYEGKLAEARAATIRSRIFVRNSHFFVDDVGRCNNIYYK